MLNPDDAAARGANIVGPGARLFAERFGRPSESPFQASNADTAYYGSVYYRLQAARVQPIPTDPPAFPLLLEDILGEAVVASILSSGKISCHVTGHLTDPQVIRSMEEDLAGDPATVPAFLFHLGDVVYEFGDADEYYDQFYEPFRGYDRPIFAIPGNHDGNIKFGATPSTPVSPSLAGFRRNFCASTPQPSVDAAGLVRSAMTQPGVYFTLEAPFLSIIGLYTNVLEPFGVISSQGGRYPRLDDRQLDWLKGELVRLRPERSACQRALIIACHHPPVSADSKHGGGVAHSEDIDLACSEAGVWPDAVLSSHAHEYQRFTREVGAKTIPYLVLGSGGHRLTFPNPRVRGKTPVTCGEYTLEREPSGTRGYLKLTVATSETRSRILTIEFLAPDSSAAHDAVTVVLSPPA